MKTETAETLSAKQYILSAAENRYNRKYTSLRGGHGPLAPPWIRACNLVMAFSCFFQ